MRSNWPILGRLAPVFLISIEHSSSRRSWMCLSIAQPGGSNSLDGLLVKVRRKSLSLPAWSSANRKEACVAILAGNDLRTERRTPQNFPDSGYLSLP